MNYFYIMRGVAGPVGNRGSIGKRGAEVEAEVDNVLKRYMELLAFKVLLEYKDPLVLLVIKANVT